MKRRSILAAVCAVAVLLTATGVVYAAATRDTSKVIPATPGATWMIKLRGTLPGAKMRELSFRGFADVKAKQRVEWTEAVTGDKYSGVDLKSLVALVDDGNAKTFNTKLAAAGYTVRVVGLDGFSYDFSSADVAKGGILVVDKVLVSGKAKETALALGTAKAITGSDSSPESVRWSPSWPVKLAGDFVAASGKMRIGGVSVIEVMPTPAE